MKDFYLVVKSKVEAGQYVLADMVADLQAMYDKGRITYTQYEELKALAETRVDLGYTGNKYPRPYDYDQDIIIGDNAMAVLEIFEMLLGGSTPTQLERFTEATERVMTRSITNIYVRFIIQGDRTFSSVPDIKKQEVADGLHAQGRCDLIDIAEYHPPHVGCPFGNEPVILPTENEVV